LLGRSRRMGDCVIGRDTKYVECDKNGIFKNLFNQALTLIPLVLIHSHLATWSRRNHPQITNNFSREPDFADEVLQLGSADDFPWSGGFGGPVVISRKSLLRTAKSGGQFRRSWRCGATARMVTRLGVWGPFQ
jgi:hypothetical protein